MNEYKPLSEYYVPDNEDPLKANLLLSLGESKELLDLYSDAAEVYVISPLLQSVKNLMEEVRETGEWPEKLSLTRDLGGNFVELVKKVDAQSPNRAFIVGTLFSEALAQLSRHGEEIGKMVSTLSGNAEELQIESPEKYLGAINSIINAMDSQIKDIKVSYEKSQKAYESTLSVN